jgi:hypothetical protein
MYSRPAPEYLSRASDSERMSRLARSLATSMILWRLGERQMRSGLKEKA